MAPLGTHWARLTFAIARFRLVTPILFVATLSILGGAFTRNVASSRRRTPLRAFPVLPVANISADDCFRSARRQRSEEVAINLALVSSVRSVSSPSMLAAAARLAMDAVNNDKSLLPGYYLGVVFANEPQPCTTEAVFRAAQGFLRDKSVRAILAPQCDEAARIVAVQALTVDLPVISWSQSQRQLQLRETEVSPSGGSSNSNVFPVFSTCLGFVTG